MGGLCGTADNIEKIELDKYDHTTWNQLANVDMEKHLKEIEDQNGLGVITCKLSHPFESLRAEVEELEWSGTEWNGLAHGWGEANDRSDGTVYKLLVHEGGVIKGINKDASGTV